VEDPANSMAIAGIALGVIGTLIGGGGFCGLFWKLGGLAKSVENLENTMAQVQENSQQQLETCAERGATLATHGEQIRQCTARMDRINGMRS